MQLIKITKLGRYFLAIPMVVFGVQHFLYAEFVVQLVPGWIPLPLFWTYFAGVALFAAGIAIILNILLPLAATLLGLMISIWVLILHIPRVVELPGDSEFINVFDALFMLSGAFLLSALVPGKVYLKKISGWGVNASPFLIILSLVVFGIEHFIHGTMVFIVGAQPWDAPGAIFWVYFTGIVFIGAAVAMLFGKRSADIAALLGIYILFISALFYAPQLVDNIYHGHLWATFLKGIGMSGTAFILSRALMEKGQPILIQRGWVNDRDGKRFTT